VTAAPRPARVDLSPRWRELPPVDGILTVQVAWYDDARAEESPDVVTTGFGYIRRLTTLLADTPDRGIRCDFRVVDGPTPDADTLAELGSDLRKHVEGRSTARPLYRMSLAEIIERVQASVVAEFARGPVEPLSASDVLHGAKAGAS